MDPRAAELIDLLALRAHPEGGFYREIHRSAENVARADGAARSALTAIYYLLVAGEPGAWHRVAADEVWHFYEGAPIELVIADAGANARHVHRLGPLGDAAQPVHIVPAGFWQAARTLGGYSLAVVAWGRASTFATSTSRGICPMAMRRCASACAASTRSSRSRRARSSASQCAEKDPRARTAS